MKRGFTLLEVLVATLIMALAVTGLLSSLSTSLGTASRLTDYDRAAQLARQKMDELLVDARAPKLAPFGGAWGPEITGNLQAGWRAQITPFEVPPGAAIGTLILERIQLEIWWINGVRRRTFALEGYRQSALTPDEAAGLGK